GDVGAGEARRFDGVEQLRQGAPGQPVRVHQMVEAIDPGRCESVGEQRRRERAHDVRADQTDQDPALAHDTPAAAAAGRKDTSPSGDTVTPLTPPGGPIYSGFCYRPTESFGNAPPAWAIEFGPSAA